MCLWRGERIILIIQSIDFFFDLNLELQYMLPHVLTPSQVIVYLYDSYQLSQEIGLPPLLWNNQICRSVRVSSAAPPHHY